MAALDLTVDEAPEAPSPFRSEAAICAMCVAVLRRVPSLGFVQGVEIRRAKDARELPNWTLKSLFPEPSRKQWDLAVTALDPWRAKYNLA